MYKSAHSRRVLFPNRKRRDHIMNSAEKTVTLLKILARKPYVYGVTELGEKIGCGKSGTAFVKNLSRRWPASFGPIKKVFIFSFQSV